MGLFGHDCLESCPDTSCYSVGVFGNLGSFNSVFQGRVALFAGFDGYGQVILFGR